MTRVAAILRQGDAMGQSPAPWGSSAAELPERSRCMSYTPCEVLRALLKPRPKFGNIKLLRKPNGYGEKWEQCLKDTVGGLLGIVTQTHQPTTGELKKRVQRDLRVANEFFKSVIPPPFVSGGYVRLLVELEWESNLCLDEQGQVYEHVIPMTLTLSGGSFLADPLACFQPAKEDGVPKAFGPLVRALLAPVCWVSKHEDLRLDRLYHPDWRRPFARYAEEAVTRDAPDSPIEVYRTRTGEQIKNLAEFTWADYRTELAATPAYARALSFLETLTEYIEKHHAIERDAIQDRAAKPARARNARAAQVPAGHYTPCERARLRNVLSNALVADVPVTRCGRPAIELPVNRARLTLVVLFPDQACKPSQKRAFRLLIGGTYDKRTLYHNDLEMHPEGRRYLNCLVEYLESTGTGLKFTCNVRDVPPSGYGCQLEVVLKDGRSMAEEVAEALPLIVKGIKQLYPQWRNCCLPPQS